MLLFFVYAFNDPIKVNKREEGECCVENYR